ncbi:peptidase [Streptomyces sp. HU2014]|uniref:Peptidase n=1 Tax=Streptomyces albireticuli TaxID=1940 RepID=A0A1Z2LDV6_9ACTN|nr:MULTISPECIES: peptidase [Streptomyces]ARZ72483.1 peptidase [Streptomyces albireticuli]UQI45832.1 peptidase [Streptomyces sp. HU2014]
MAVGVAVGLPLAGDASTGTPAAAVSGVRVQKLHQDPQQVLDFWTPERMRGARRLSREAGSPRPEATGRTDHADGQATPVVVRPTVPRTPPPDPPKGSRPPGDFPDGGSPWKGDGLVSRTVGTVFLTSPAVVGEVACDGVAVMSHNKSVVLTKGSCTDLIDMSITSWVFAPGYHDGRTPYGLWMATQLFSLPEWHDKADDNFDVGAATVVGIPVGKSLVDTVGGQGVAFNQVIHPHPKVYMFGYWSQQPKTLYYCSGRSVDDPNPPPRMPQALYCPVAGGAAWGSPWFLGFDEETGVGIVNAIDIGNSYNLDYQLAPYFGDRIEDLYDQAQNSPVTNP